MRSRSPQHRRHRSRSRSDSHHRRRRRSHSDERRERRDRYDRPRNYETRSPRRGGVSNPPPEHPDHNPGNNLYISNLSSHITEPDLRDTFSKYGELKEIRIICDPYTKESRGFGFVTFETATGADDALRELDKQDLDGRELHVERARRSRPHDSTPGSYCGPAGASSKYRHSHRTRRSPSPLRRRKNYSRSISASR